MTRERWGWVAPIRRGLLAAAGGCGLLGFLAHYGFHIPVSLLWLPEALRGVAVGGFLLEGILAALTVRPWRAFLRARWPLLALTVLLAGELLALAFGGSRWLAPLTGLLSVQTVAQVYVVALQAFVLGNLLANLPRVSERLAAWKVRPLFIFLLAFVVVILLGALLLSLPRATPREHPISFVDALFTSTSAVCVTGLVVRDTGAEFTRLGHWIVLGLIQLGGLGIMSVTATMLLLFGRGLGLKQGSLLREIYQIDFLDQVGRTLRFIVAFTVVAEAAGALLLYHGLHGAVADRSERLFYAAFHAVSAFCNAGFALFPDNLASFAGRPQVYLPVAALLVAGGLGFPVVGNVLFSWRARLAHEPPGPHRRLTVQTRAVLRTTAILLGLGTVALALLEWNGAFAGRAWGERLGLAFFQAASPRTAGFNTVDLLTLAESSLVLQIVLMFIGASSGSTGGGIKTNTLAVLWANLRAIATANPRARLFDREIGVTASRQAFFVFLAHLAVATLAVIVLLWTERAPLLPIGYEVYSALGTVGLSLNFTPTLSLAGRLVIILVMFFGRVGPLSIAYGVVRPTHERGVRMPESRLMVG